MRSAIFTLLVLCGGGQAFACINTTYSRLDELEITGDLGHLIIGAFAHHGDAFYQNEVGRCLAILDETPDDFDARNDLGAAYTKLGKWEKAKAAFEENERRHPGQYKTASNLGVLYKKMGEYKLAGEWIEKALQFEPGGHMGLGDYYLRMIQWRQASPADYEATANFLGVPYEAGSAATAAAANREYVVTLIKNDMNFADAYFVLGDILFGEQDYQLALRAYYRAKELAHPNYHTIDGRLQEIANIWRGQSRPGYVVERDLGYHQVLDEFEAARGWLLTYQAIEAERIQAGQDVSFAQMKTVLAERGIEKPRIIEAGHYRGTARDSYAWVLWALAGFLLFMLCISVVAIAVVLRVIVNKRKSAVVFK